MGQKENTEQCSAAARPPGGCCDQLLRDNSSLTPSRESCTTTKNPRLIHCCLLQPRVSMPQGVFFFSYYLLLLRCRGAGQFGDRRRLSSPQPLPRSANFPPAAGRVLGSESSSATLLRDLEQGWVSSPNIEAIFYGWKNNRSSWSTASEAATASSLSFLQSASSRDAAQIL